MGALIPSLGLSSSCSLDASGGHSKFEKAAEAAIGYWRGMYIDDLFANHLLFMATHRGSVRLEDLDFHIQGPAPSLVSFVPGSPDSAVPENCPAVRLAPWSGGEAWDDRLEAQGYARAEALAYMELGDSNRPLTSADGIEVEVAQDARAAEAFAAIQAAGFATGDASIDDWWGPYFTDQARKNYNHPAQVFYLGRTEDQFVTCTLIVRTPGVSGIYAVATKPDFRKRGVSTAVLDRARLDALKAGFPRIILQAMRGSYAESYYGKLGFLTRYFSQVWRR
jgi:GNAT superfamily N-acetyltransferase